MRKQGLENVTLIIDILKARGKHGDCVSEWLNEELEGETNHANSYKEYEVVKIHEERLYREEDTCMSFTSLFIHFFHNLVSWKGYR